ncbi:unnamed protein product [Cylicostephanus goldi]|uniref:Uncharacterized protein n=1 Tax=Cylicostephanus goldi TaxID=71465 RepID=A0A3P7MK85_CYLGO|nr:unnamed protein product [Cylicostephanus goldi]
MLVAESENGEPLADLNQIIDCFMEVQAVQPCTSFLLEVLKVVGKLFWFAICRRLT